MPDRTAILNKTDAAAALQRLVDAGDDVPKLIEAVKNASFLEDVPSPERQTLRAHKRKLKRALVKQSTESRRSLFQTKAEDTERYVKSDKKFAELCDEYQGLKWRIVKMPGGATRKADHYYTLHGLMMQATRGNLTESCPMFAENGNIDFHGRFQWDSWNLAKGLTNAQAREKFVAEYFKFPSTELYKDSRSIAVKAQPQAARA